jgi:hypothetical protein
MTDSSPANHENGQHFPSPLMGRVRVGVTHWNLFPLTLILSHHGRGGSLVIFYVIQATNFLTWEKIFWYLVI